MLRVVCASVRPFFFAMSVSCADGNGSHGTYHVYQRIPNRIPTEQRSALIKGRIRSWIQQRLWVHHTHAAEEVLRVIRINHIAPHTHTGALAVHVLVNKILERVAKPGLVAVAEGVFAS
jgi:hypothetical protein